MQNLLRFLNVYDSAFMLRKEVEHLNFESSVSLILCTDSNTVFDVISRGTKTSEKRSMLDVDVATKGFKCRVISGVGFIRSESNLADWSYKPNHLDQTSLRY